MSETKNGTGDRGQGRGKKTRGRPAGSRNVRREIVELTPPNCPACGRSVSVNLSTVPTSVHHYAGTTSGGQPYDRVEWRNVQCDCGQHLRVRTPIKESED